MDASEALQKHAQRPDEYPLTEVTVNGVDYLAFGDHAFKKDALTSLEVYPHNGQEFYSLESLVIFLKYSNEGHGFYVKEAAAANVRAVTRIDRKNVTNFLKGDGSEFSGNLSMESGISLKQLTQEFEPPEAKKPRLDVDEATTTAPAADQNAQPEKKKEEVEIRALNNDLTKDRIAEMRRKRQKNLEKGIVNIDESLSTLTSASLPKTRIHRTRENVMLGVRDLSNVLEVIQSAQRQWDIDEKKEKVAAVHSIAGGRDQQQQRSGYSRYAQEAFAHEKTKEIQTEGSFIGSNLTALKQGNSAPNPTSPSTFRPPIAPVIPKPTTSSTLATSSSGKRASRSPIIIVPSAMNTMVNLYNARDILQNFQFVSVEQRRKETNKKPQDLAIQRQKNGTTYNIRVIDQAEKLGSDDWDRVIGVFVMGVGWQFKGWKWNGNPTDIFTHVPAFHLYFDSNKPCPQVMQWNCQKIPISATKRHMDKAKFQAIWEQIEHFVRKHKPHLNQRLGLH
ncbi:hypothetical protein L5515_005531 [Caenorhabditis briggsae]|uniref:Parafibromin n=1 Tax=Caenorhabditis briggsae TaxID=6238 RepID=A0AAE9EPK1_CAEBR|nr:hypothetical protein L5515_005531 [Caenorhabditis briggsae]